jgi:dUTP pyrophosphatase
MEDHVAMALKMKKIKPEAEIPKYATIKSAGLDLKAVGEYNIPAGQQQVVWTGLAIQIPGMCMGMVCSRSGLAAKDGVFVANSPGIIDADYCGDNDEVGVILYNTGSVHENFQVKTGDRIAQLIITSLYNNFYIEEVETLGNEDRSGFGSTGKA